MEGYNLQESADIPNNENDINCPNVQETVTKINGDSPSKNAPLTVTTTIEKHDESVVQSPNSPSRTNNNSTQKKYKRFLILDSEKDSDSNEEVNDTEEPQKQTQKILDNNDSEKENDKLSQPEIHSRTILDDSDSEGQSEQQRPKFTVKQRPKKILEDSSDSEKEEETESERPGEENHTEGAKNVTITKRLKRIIDSDSEGELEEQQQKQQTSVYISNEKGELIPENIPDIDQVHKSKLSALCDSESSEDEHSNQETERPQTEEDEHLGHERPIKPIPYKKAPSNKNKEKKMTGKEAAEQRKEIEIESQRRIRETNVSLPYHRPKSYSLKEFLEKRSRFASSVPEAAKIAAPIAIKMSKEQLELVSKKIEEREKEVEQFYKSESETSDHENDEETAEEPQQNSPDELKETEAQPSEETPKSNLEDTVVEHPETVITENTNEGGIMDSGIGTSDTVTAMECSTDEFEVSKEVSTVVENFINHEENDGAAINCLSEDYDFNIDDIEENQPSKSNKTTVELIKEKFGDVQPRLSGGPNELIDLETGTVRPSEISKLMERFFKHTAKPKPTTNHKIHMSIVSVDKGEVHEETVDMTVDDEEPIAIMEKPGAKLQKLRSELETQMAKRRTEFWTAKKQEKDNTYEGEKSDCGDEENDYYDTILDDEEEMTESSASEEEPIEDDVEISDKNTKKSVFIDGEAEESETEEVGDIKEITEADDDEEVQSESEHEADNEQLEEKPQKKKQLRRIIKVFDDEDDESETDETSALIFKNFDTPTNKEQYESTISCEDDYIPSHQIPNSNTPIRLTQSKDTFEFLTPVSYLTGLQSMSSASKFLKEASPYKELQAAEPPSPLKNTFNDSQSELSSQVSQTVLSEDPTSDAVIVEPTTQELLEVCSGNFTGVQPLSEPNLEESQPSTQDLLGLCSGGFTGSESTTSTKTVLDLNSAAGKGEIKSLDHENDDQIISQLLDEDEMEQFKKKFVSPPPTVHRKNRIIFEGDEVASGGGIIMDSDDDGDENGGALLEVRRKKKKKQLVFSDEEESDVEEEIDLHDGDDDEVIDNIGYDSEENEIDLEQQEEQVQAKPSDFFEDEAELSESEWGSADEDENDLDQMEFELADNEKIDQTQVQRDLERIHLRRMLDEDNREVKILQELYLEDGELHGTGRQRQFRWKNIDSTIGDEPEGNCGEDEPLFEDEETEEQWRKTRHEREMFLQQKNSQTLDDLNDENNSNSFLSESQIFKFGLKAKVTTTVKNAATPPTIEKTLLQPEEDAGSSPQVLKQPLALLGKRGSFLSRSDQVLERLAEFTKTTSSKTVIGGTAKNSRNFIFQTVSTEETTTQQLTINAQDKKRKASLPNGGTPNAIKKLRLSNNFSPANAVTTKNLQASKNSKNNRARNLFNVKQW